MFAKVRDRPLSESTRDLIQANTVPASMHVPLNDSVRSSTAGLDHTPGSGGARSRSKRSYSKSSARPPSQARAASREGRDSPSLRKRLERFSTLSIGGLDDLESSDNTTRPSSSIDTKVHRSPMKAKDMSRRILTTGLNPTAAKGQRQLHTQAGDTHIEATYLDLRSKQLSPVPTGSGSGASLKRPSMLLRQPSRKILDKSSSSHGELNIKTRCSTVYTWGEPLVGQLNKGGARKDFDIGIIPNLTDANIVQVAACEDRFVAMTRSGLVCEWGMLSYRPQPVGSWVIKPRVLNSQQFGVVVQVDCGAHHSAMLTRDGRVHVWGSTSHNKLGLGHSRDIGKYASEPITVTSLKVRAMELACGRQHTCVLSKKGDIWVWGQFLQTLWTITKFPFIEKIKAFAAGDDTIAAVTASGKLYVWGYFWSDSKDVEPLTPVDKPKAVEELSDIATVACGGRNVVALTEDGHVYLWGKSLLPTSKRHKDVALSEPTYRDHLPPIIQVACGTNHAAVLTASGTIYAFGSNEFRQVDPTSTELHIAEPVMLKPLIGKGVNHILCGSQATCAVVIEHPRSAHVPTKAEVEELIDYMDEKYDASSHQAPANGDMRPDTAPVTPKPFRPGTSSQQGASTPRSPWAREAPPSLLETTSRVTEERRGRFLGGLREFTRDYDCPPLTPEQRQAVNEVNYVRSPFRGRSQPSAYPTAQARLATSPSANRNGRPVTTPHNIRPWRRESSVTFEDEISIGDLDDDEGEPLRVSDFESRTPSRGSVSGYDSPRRLFTADPKFGKVLSSDSISQADLSTMTLRARKYIDSQRYIPETPARKIPAHVLTSKPRSRSRGEVRDIVRALSKLHCFRDLTTDDLDDIATHCDIESINADVLLYEKGDRAEAWFVLLEGVCLIESASHRRTVCEGDAFGDAGLLKDDPVGDERVDTVTTVEPCVVVILSKERYRLLHRNAQKENESSVLQLLASIPLFARQGRQFLTRLAPQLVSQHYEPGAVIIKHGDSSRHLYLLMEGDCHVRKHVVIGYDDQYNLTAEYISFDTASKPGRTRRITIHTFRRGDIFGEVGLVFNRKRNATVLAGKNGARVLSLNKNQLWHLPDSLLDSLRQRASYLDVKIPAYQALKHGVAPSMWKAYEKNMVDALISMRHLANEVMRGEFTYDRSDSVMSGESQYNLSASLPHVRTSLSTTNLQHRGLARASTEMDLKVKRSPTFAGPSRKPVGSLLRSKTTLHKS